MDKNTSHEAALKLINDIALVNTELAAKIKPSIDMFIESLDSTLSNNELFNQLTEFFKLTDDNAKKEWLNQHKDLAAKIEGIFDSMNKQSSTLNEDVQKNDVMENGETKIRIPVHPDDEEKEDKKEKKSEDKKENKKSEDKKDDEKDHEEKEADEKPVEPKDLELPEDGFKDNKITMPLKTDGDDKREPPKDEKVNEFPPVDPKVVDITKDQTEEVKVPNLSNMKPTIEVESMRKIYKTLVEKKIVKEAVADKYAEFLGQCQLDWATTNIENGTVRPGIAKFVPIRKYATQLFDKFKDEFASYADALATAKEWYATQGKRRREADRITPSNVYVELRKGKDSNFVVNVYLVKTEDLNVKDADMASDLFSAFTDEFVDDQPAEKIWIKLPKQLRTPRGIATVYMISLPFPKDNKKGIVLSRVKHDIVNQIRADYKDYYLPTTKIPSWVYSQNESVNEAKEVDYKQIYRDVIKQILDSDNTFDVVDFVNEDEVKNLILNKIPERLEYYCDVMDVDFVEAANALDDEEIDALVDDAIASASVGESIAESESFEFVEDDVDYNDEMQQVIDGLCEEYIDEWLKGKTTEKPVDFVLDRLNKEATLQAKLNDFDADEFINSFTIDELKKMIEVIMDRKWQYKEDLRDAIDHDMEMRESVEVNEGVEYNRDEVDELAREFIDDLIELGDNRWDMDGKEFIEWTWGWNGVPRSEIPYISKRWDIMRTVYRNNVYKK